MEQMEVTPVPLDNDNIDNININGSNSLTANEVNSVLNPSVGAISIHSEDDQTNPSLTEESPVEIKTNNISSISCLTAKLPEILDNIQLRNGTHASERNDDLGKESGSTGNGINYVGSCKSGFQNMDEACSAKSVPKIVVNQCPTEVLNEKIQNAVCNTDTDSTGIATASVSENSVDANDFANHTPAISDEATKLSCGRHTIQPSECESEYDLSKINTVGKECDVIDKQFQFDGLQKQASEIKDRVMGFLTKYTTTDDASCSSHSSVLSTSKQVCLDEKQILNKENIDSKIVWREQCGTINPKNVSNHVTTRNTEEPALASTQTPKFNLTSVSKNSVPVNFLQTSNVCSSPRFTHQKDAINWQTICSFDSQVPSQGNSNFNVSGDETLSTTSISTSCKRECSLKTFNDVTENHESDNSSEANTNDSSFQPNCEIKMNSFEQEVKQNCQFSNSKSGVESDPICGIPGKNSTGMKQPNDVNPGHTSDEFLFPSNNDILGNKMQFSPSQKLTTNPFNEGINWGTFIVQRSTNIDSVNTWLSWGKMSGELHTTHSINSPILSSKSSDDSSSSKQIPFPNSSFSPNICHDKAELALKSGSKSRRARSSDCMFYDIPKPFGNGATGFSSIGSSISQKSDNSCLIKPGEIDETNLSHTSYTNCGNTSKISFTPQHNLNKNSQGTLGNLGKSMYCASGETLDSDYKRFDKPFGNITKGNMENPFTKKSPVESIGLFKSPPKSAVCEAENPVFKPVSSLLFPPKREKTEECPGNEEVSEILQPAASNDPFGFPLEIKNKHNEASNTSAEIAFNNLCSNESFVTTSEKISNCEQTSNRDISERTPFGNFERVPSQINSNSFFQFTFTPEKSKTFCTSTVTLPRSKKPTRPIKQFQKVTLKGNVPSNVPGKGTAEIPFKPVYGSDVKFEKGMYKNVIVRYQNIVFMEDHTNVSPEELRSQFYSKAFISGPFKFGACMESHENVSKDFKKTQNQEIQTDEKIASQNPDLTAIWRVLECPVCLDVVLPPVYQCEQGHHACATCWTKVLTCPLCKRPQSCTRNYMAEALVEQVPLPCRYHIEGCKETVQHNSKVNHEENCSFRMYQCPAPMCNQALGYQNMCKHFKKHHKNILHHEGHSVGKGEKFCDVLYKEALSSFLVHAFDITKWGLFFLRKVAVGLSTALFVQVMPAASDQAVYFYHLEVCDHHDCRKECFKGRVFPMCKPSQEIINQEEYLCLSELILKTVKKTTPLKIIVTIWQLKPSFTLSS